MAEHQLWQVYWMWPCRRCWAQHSETQFLTIGASTLIPFLWSLRCGCTRPESLEKKGEGMFHPGTREGVDGGKSGRPRLWYALYTLLKFSQSHLSFSAKWKRLYIPLEGSIKDLSYFMWKPEVARLLRTAKAPIPWPSMATCSIIASSSSRCLSKPH